MSTVFIRKIWFVYFMRCVSMMRRQKDAWTGLEPARLYGHERESVHEQKTI